MKQLCLEAVRLLGSGESFVQATILASSGSTPRGTGSCMLVLGDGSIRGTVGGGALEGGIIKASSEVLVPMRKSNPAIDPVTGKRVYSYTNDVYVDSKGRSVKRTSASTRMAETDDAFTLSSGRQIELVYAGYANELKGLANSSRVNALNVRPIPYSPSARVAYDSEVLALNAKLNVALMNKPVERQAQIMANSVVKRKRLANPNMDRDDVKKVSNQALAEARARTGAKKDLIAISEREWEAIQAGAISPSRLGAILQNADLDRVKQLATPRVTVLMTPAKVERAKAMLVSGYTQAEVAEAIGVSVGTLAESVA